MCDNDFTVDFYRELTTIVCNISIFFKKEEKFCIFPLSHFLKKCKLNFLRFTKRLCRFIINKKI